MPRAAATASSSSNPSPPSAAAPVTLIHGDDDFAVKQRARQLYQEWSAPLRN
jgi:hypothetical protein